VPIRAVPDQKLEDVQLIPRCRDEQRGRASKGPCFKLRSCIYQELDNLHSAERRSIVKNSRLNGTGHFDVCAMLDQRLDHARFALRAGVVEMNVAFCIYHIRVCATSYQIHSNVGAL